MACIKNLNFLKLKILKIKNLSSEIIKYCGLGTVDQ